MTQPIAIRIEPTATGYRWYVRNDYSTADMSGRSVTIREALVEIAARFSVESDT